MIKIAPSILTADFCCLEKTLHDIQKTPIDYLHLDVMDGVFVPNLSFGPMVIRSIKSYWQKIMDVHLMIVEPEKYIQHYAEAGADIITIHYEACRHLHRTIQQIKSLNKKVGVALNPATPIHVLEDIIHDVDLVLLMSVNPGFGGQTFIVHTLHKIEQLYQWKKKHALHFLIEVDGGVNAGNIADLNQRGVDVAVVGSALINGANLSNNYHQIAQALTV